MIIHQVRFEILKKQHNGNVPGLVPNRLSSQTVFEVVRTSLVSTYVTYLMRSLFKEFRHILCDIVYVKQSIWCSLCYTNYKIWIGRYIYRQPYGLHESDSVIYLLNFKILRNDVIMTNRGHFLQLLDSLTTIYLVTTLYSIF